MPNHVQNNLTLMNESEADIKKFKGLFHEDGDFISLNKIIPMPESLNIESGSRSSKAEKIINSADPEKALADYLAEMREDGHYTDEDCEEFKKLVEQVKYNLDNYGFPTWYDWSLKNWGIPAHSVRQSGGGHLQPSVPLRRDAQQSVSSPGRELPHLLAE